MTLPLPHQVVVAGAGVAGLEALLALHALAAGHVTITVLAPEDAFVMDAASVGTPFGHGLPPSHALAEIVAAHGAHLVHRSLHAVRRGERLAIARDGSQLPYDALLVATGAEAEPAFEHALTFGGAADADAVASTLGALEAGRLASVAYVVPPGVTWAVPAYELALLTAAHAELHGLDATVTLVTPEPHPLAVLGREASEHATRTLAAAGVVVLAGTEVDDVEPAGVLRGRSRRVLGEAERIIALPRLRGPYLAGLPHDEDGFLPVDDHARVPGPAGVYGAGDVTTAPLKQGGLGAQQAEHAARAIARRAGASVAAPPLRPVLRAQLLEGGEATFLRMPLHARGQSTQAVLSPRALWWPPLKVAAPRLDAWLGARA